MCGDWSLSRCERHQGPNHLGHWKELGDSPPLETYWWTQKFMKGRATTTGDSWRWLAHWLRLRFPFLIRQIDRLTKTTKNWKAWSVFGLLLTLSTLSPTGTDISTGTTSSERTARSHIPFYIRERGEEAFTMYFKWSEQSTNNEVHQSISHSPGTWLLGCCSNMSVLSVFFSGKSKFRLGWEQKKTRWHLKFWRLRSQTVGLLNFLRIWFFRGVCVCISATLKIWALTMQAFSRHWKTDFQSAEKGTCTE